MFSVRELHYILVVINHPVLMLIQVTQSRRATTTGYRGYELILEDIRMWEYAGYKRVLDGFAGMPGLVDCQTERAIIALLDCIEYLLPRCCLSLYILKGMPLAA